MKTLGKLRVFFIGLATGCLLTASVVAGAPYLRTKAIEALKGLLADGGVEVAFPSSPQSTPYPAPKNSKR